MESPSSPKRVAAAGSDDDRVSVCYGIRVDDGWEYQTVCVDTPGCKQARTRTFPCSGPDCPQRSLTVTRFPQLAGVAEGLIYMHCQGVIHGDLKGVRIQGAGPAAFF